MATSLIEEERIQTTAAKAKELRRIVEPLITLGRNNALSVVNDAASDDEKTRLRAARVAAVRQAGKVVRNRDALQKLFGDLAERFAGRPGGYTRTIRIGRRLGDNAELAVIELLPAGFEKAASSAPTPSAPATPAADPEFVAEDAVNDPAAEEVEAEPAVEEAAAEPAVEEAAAEPAVEEAAAEPAVEEAAAEPAAEEAAAEPAAETEKKDGE